VNLYAESSAVLAWLMGEPAGELARRSLAEADRVLASALTALECARAVGRAATAGRLAAAEELAALRLLDVAEAGWDVHDLSDRVLARARLRFPVEPLRTLDALHLATASLFCESLGRLTLLSFDERIRANAPGLGLDLIPRQLESPAFARP